MVKQNIKTTKTTIEAHTWTCPICSKEIIGSTPQQVSFNAGLHLDSHKEKSK